MSTITEDQLDEKNIALDAIRHKLVGRELSYKEIYAIMDQIAQEKLDDILMTYFVASGYSKGFSDEEIYYLTKAMVSTGEHLEFKGIIADKHSIGGTPGTRATMVIVPIIAAAGFTIPKSSSRAITTPAGTADSMEVLASVSFTKERIYKIVEKTGGCIVWGGSFKIAPADDDIIRIEKPLMFESFDKILVSVMAKKIAFGSNHVVIDIPYGKTVKVHGREDGEVLGQKFERLAEKFGLTLRSYVHRVDEPAGGGIGPLLEAKDALAVLEQRGDRPLELEKRSLELAGLLLELCLSDVQESKRKEVQEQFGSAAQWAKNILISGEALRKMKEIIKAQDGNAEVESTDLRPARFGWDMKATRGGKIIELNNLHISQIAKILGAPTDHKAGMFIYKMKSAEVKKGDILATFYGSTKYKVSEAIDSLEIFPILNIV